MKKIFIFLVSIIFVICLTSCDHKQSYPYLNKNDEDVKRITEINVSGRNYADYISGLHWEIGMVQNAGMTFYSAYINENSYYVVVSYIDEKLYEAKRTRSGKLDYYQNVVWMKYDSLDDVATSVDNLQISDVFIVYDILIEKDVINDKIYNETYKYYQDVTDEFLYNQEINRFSKTTKILLFREKELNKDNFYVDDFDYKLSHQMDINEQSETFFVFRYRTTYIHKIYGETLFEDLEYKLTTLYDILIDYVIYDDSLQTTIIKENATMIIEKVKINTEVIKNLIDEGLLKY